MTGPRPDNLAQPLVQLADPLLNADSLMLADIEVADPLFSVSQVAQFFFARSPHWLRWREEKGFLTLEGREVGVTRTTVGKWGQRRYNLADIEQIAHALAQKGAITTPQLLQALRIVKAEAKLWGYIE